MPEQKKRIVPQRTCIVCRSKRAKPELLRLALDGESRICLDRRQRYPGRGCYVCRRPECLARLKQSHLQKAFRRSLPETAWDPGLVILESLRSWGEAVKE